ncbi:hypothetical protein H2201_007699 [Coniosporium apollinis]|uniref:Uncharacterized protein n=1 Tax=Coniosporium apollinis TaxID=61459 RepID=A0ABQ9NIX7_9PEZI|nr:hypothetical protein H2201_007699 [Coniosporium apollinis]
MSDIKLPSEVSGKLDGPPSLSSSLFCFPSPAGEDFPALSPQDVVPRHLQQPNLDDSLLGIAIPEPIARPTVGRLPTDTPTATPRQEIQREFGLAAFGGGAHLPSTVAGFPTPPILKAAHSLRLPSFDLLGIANPHPDRLTQNHDQYFPGIGAGPLSNPADPLHAQSPLLSRARPPTESTVETLPNPSKGIQRSVKQIVHTFTPPDDRGTIDWSALPHVRTAAMDSPARSDPEARSPGIGETSASTAPPSPEPLYPSAEQASGDRPWLRGALEAVIDNVDSEGGTSGSVRILTHALPCPVSAGHVFPTIINAIHDRIPPRSTVWINVLHAVPGRFNLADLPSSPPSTPGPAIGGDDYFATKVFDSAVAVADYQSDGQVLSRPHPVVPPSTVDVSIVERYIPPTSVNEFADMFSSGARSILLDRLVELSHNDGTLVLIYPTLTGGRTFMVEYLGPILDPLLRAMTVVNELSADLGITLGSMSAVDHLLEFDQAKSKLERYLRHLTNHSSTLGKFHSKKAKFELIHASNQEVKLERKVWATEWWIKQEKARVRATVTKYFRLAHKLPTDSEIMPTHLIQEILDGVATKPCAMEPTKGVEVGVFVIRKSQHA